VSEPWKPAKYKTSDIAAVQALAAGVANEGQQQQALKWIVEVAAGVYQPSFYSGADGDRLTAFAEGKRFVGNSIISAIAKPLGVLMAQDEGKNEIQK